MNENENEREVSMRIIKRNMLDPGQGHVRYEHVQIACFDRDTAVVHFEGIGAQWTRDPRLLMTAPEAEAMAELALERAEHLLVSAVQLQAAAECVDGQVVHHLENVVSSLMRCLREEIHAAVMRHNVTRNED